MDSRLEYEISQGVPKVNLTPIFQKAMSVWRSLDTENPLYNELKELIDLIEATQTDIDNIKALLSTVLGKL